MFPRIALCALVVLSIGQVFAAKSAARPGAEWNGADAPPLPGRSLAPAFAKDVPVPRDFRRMT
jgi:hypothetical protein